MVKLKNCVLKVYMAIPIGGITAECVKAVLLACRVFAIFAFGRITIIYFRKIRDFLPLNSGHFSGFFLLRAYSF